MTLFWRLSNGTSENISVVDGRKGRSALALRDSGHDGLGGGLELGLGAGGVRPRGEGRVEVEITRESLQAFENEHPEHRGKFTKR